MQPDSHYIYTFLADTRRELEGWHTRIIETEAIRYLEDPIRIPSDEIRSGIEVRIGATAEIIKNVKGATSVNPPRIVIESRIEKEGVEDNKAKREHFYNRLLERWMGEGQSIQRFLDSIIANGTGFLKAATIDYPEADRHRSSSGGRFTETPSEHVERVKALKRVWGPPFEVIDVHPLQIFYKRGQGYRISEVCEHSYKPRVDMFRQYGFADKKALENWSATNFDQRGEISNRVARMVRSMVGQPDQDLRPWPYGITNTNMTLVTEYWSPDCYQTWLDRHLIYEETDPHVAYFMAVGEINSSNDPDKAGFGVAEIMRHNEPAVNRAITRVLEANELVGRKPAIETPEGGLPDTQLDKDGNMVPKVYRFKSDNSESLPPGSRIVDPFAGVQHVYQSLPAVNLLLSIMGEHGVSPLFKGTPVSSDASGYRENSLYMMAKAQLTDLIKSYTNALTELFKWVEKEIVAYGETVYIDELELSPADITKWPARITITLEPKLPQNTIAEGSFWDRMFASGHVSRRQVRERGWNEEDPAAIEREVFVEQLKESVKPQLALDIMAQVLANPSLINSQEMTTGAPGDVVTQNPGIGSMGQETGGYARGGQPNQQVNGSTPPGVPAGGI